MGVREEIRAAIAKARQTPDKELFDLQTFRQHYDVTADTDGGPLSMQQVEEYEEQYYLLAQKVMTLAEFAEYRRKLKEHDAG